MRTSNLPRNLVVVIFFFLSTLTVNSGCTSKKIAVAHSRPREPSRVSALVVNINTADRAELQKLPQVGPVLAEKIIGHRTRYGPFRKPEHILIVEGVSQKRFNNFEQFIDTE